MQVRGKGSIIPRENRAKRRCRKWKIEVSLGKDSEGVYRKKAKTVYGTYTDAENALREFTNEIEITQLEAKASTTFGEYSAHWLVQRKLTHSNGTWRKNCNHIKCANMHLRKKRLNDITPQNLENMYQSLLDGDSPSGKMLSGTYVSGIAATLHTLFRDCIREGLLMNNPCDIARAPTVDTPERKALKADSIIELIEQLDPAQPTQLCLLLMVKTGMRRGEAHGLSWGDITDNAIRITHSYDDAGNLKGTKTKKSNREIPLTDSVRADLEIRRQQMLQDLVQTGHRARIRPDMPVICNELRERILPHATTRWFARNRARLGLDGWTPHEMRHSYLSELARRGVPVKILQELAGHENYQTTMNIYVHVSEEDKKNAIKVVDW